MTRLRVDLPALLDLVDRMQRYQDHLTACRDDVDRRVAAMHLVWTGEAASMHAQAHRQWTVAAAEVQAALAGLRLIVTTAHGNYASAQLANRRMWAQ